MRKFDKRGGAALLTLALAVASATAGVQVTPLPVFGEGTASGASAWRSPDGTHGAVRRAMVAGRPGVSLPCKLATADDRVFWDAAVTLNLSSFTGVGFRLRVHNADAVRRVSLYFRSGSGWYGAWVTPAGTNWMDIALDRGAFSVEDQPTGWNSIDRVRIAAWRGSGRDTVLDVADLHGIRHDIVVVRNARLANEGGNAAWNVNHYCTLTTDWLARMGIAAGMVDDTDIVTGLPPTCRVAILPHNSGFSDADVPAMRAFVARGGVFILSYVLPDALEPLLGIREKGWRAASTPGEFAAIHFPGRAAEGFPNAIRQDSWNVIVPEPVSATVLGTWRDAAGRDTEIPAVTVNTNGAYIGHVLTNMDQEQKGILLAALIARLRPDMRAELAGAIVTHAEHLLHARNWPDARAFLQSEARRTGRMQVGDSNVAAIEAYRAQTQALLKDAPFADLLARAQVTRRMLCDAYLALLSSEGRDNEFRGLWCHSAEGVPPADWHAVARIARRNGFTAILANALWAGKAFYPSSVLPVAPEVATRGDLLGACVAACHANGLQMHAWKVCWNLRGAPEPWVAELRKAGRLQSPLTNGDAPWLCPSHPDNLALERDSLLEVADRYPVDGIHLDYIRYPDSNACFCDGCRTRFAATRGKPIAEKDWPACVRQGRPLRDAFLDWRREQITRLVRAVRTELRARHPNVKLSAAVFAGYPECRETLGQDWHAWMREGLLDFVCPMNYTADDRAFESQARRNLALPAHGVALYSGIGASAPGLPPEQVARQIDLLRSLGANGFVLFELDADTLARHLPALGRGVTRVR